MTVGKLAGLGVTWDDGVPVGFQVGKAAALLDWEHRREGEDFRKLCARLRMKRWYVAHRERARSAARARWEANRQAILAKMRAAYARKAGPKRRCTCERCGGTFYSRRKVARWCSKRCTWAGRSAAYRKRTAKPKAPKAPPMTSAERRLAKLAASPPLVCELCGKEWRITKKGQKPRRYCSDYCMNRAKYVNSPRGRSVKTPHMGAMTRALLACLDDWRTFRYVREHSNVKPQSIGGTLDKLMRAGRVEKRGTFGRGGRCEYRRRDASL